MTKTMLPIAMTAILFFGSAMAATDSTTVGGKMFADLTSIRQTVDGHATGASGYGFDVKRFYLSVDHIFGPTWSARLITDFNYVRGDNETQVFVKKAYAQANFGRAAVLRIGSAGTPWIPFVEGIYRYRYIDKPVMDRLKLANSADWGLHLGGVLGKVFRYQVALLNGAGYKHPGRGSDMDLGARLSYQPSSGLVLAIGGYSGHLGQDRRDKPALHTARREEILAAYVQRAFRIGAQYFRANNWNNVTTIATDSAAGWSVFGVLALAPAVELFARYDHVRLSEDIDPASTDRYAQAGISFALRKGIDIAFAWKHERRNSSVHILRTDEIGLWMQVKF